MPKLTRYVSRLHKVLGLVIGAQLLLWTLSGLFFALRPIEEVRGEHLRGPARTELPVLPEGLLPAAEIQERTGDGVRQLRLKPYLGGVVWEAETDAGLILLDALTGAPRSPVPEEEARQLALDGWAGRGELANLQLVNSAPQETGRKGRALWRADFTGKDTATFWIDPDKGEIVAVRTNWWRAFDLFWGLHIMDWQGRETISSWWMKLFAFGALMLTVAGGWLLVDRARKGRLFS